MEAQLQRPGNKPAGSRLQKQAPAALQLDNVDTAACNGWENGAPDKSPIPLLSPLAIVDDSFQDSTMEMNGEVEEMDDRLTRVEAGAWKHPALPSAAVMEPAALLPMFQSQCGFGH